MYFALRVLSFENGCTEIGWPIYTLQMWPAETGSLVVCPIPVLARSKVLARRYFPFERRFFQKVGFRLESFKELKKRTMVGILRCSR